MPLETKRYTLSTHSPNSCPTQGSKGAVDKEFFRKVKPLIKIAIPGVRSKEFLHLVLLTICLVLRTFLSIYIASINGNIVKSIVKRNFRLFIRRVSFRAASTSRRSSSC